MSGGINSIESSIRTCKVDTAYANKTASDRFLNPNLMVCPIWGGRDLKGRKVCADSFNTKRAGCNSAMDRVAVENDVFRPSYMEYLTLHAKGVDGEVYGVDPDLAYAEKDLDNVDNITGNFGLSWKAQKYPNCPTYPMKERMAAQKQAEREQQAMVNGYRSTAYRNRSGM